MLADIDHESRGDPALDGFVDDPISGPPGCFHAPSGPNRQPTD
jgi:hypothetical protein